MVHSIMERRRVRPSMMQARGRRTDDEARYMAGVQDRKWSEHDVWWANHQEPFYAMEPMLATVFPRSMTLRINSNLRQIMINDVQQRNSRYMPTMINVAGPAMEASCDENDGNDVTVTPTDFTEAHLLKLRWMHHHDGWSLRREDLRAWATFFL